MKFRYFIFIISAAAVFFSCKKVNENPQWDIEVLGPLAHASLGINQLISDTLLATDVNGALSIKIDTTYSNFTLDSVYQVPDTFIKTSVIFPAFPSTITPNTPFLSNNNNVTLGVPNVQLTNANITSGFIKLEFKNTLQSKIFFTYKIPKAKKNGIPFTITVSVDSASLASPSYFSDTYDFSGYSLDMTGSSGTLFNTISYNVEARSDPNGQSFALFGSDTLINLKTSLIQIVPDYAKGYLGQTTIIDNKNINLGVGGLIKGGNIKLDSVTMKFDITNYVGADLQIYLNQVLSVNNRQGNVIPLSNSNLIRHYININRATEPYFASYSPVPFNYSIILNKGNSNITDLIENIPDILNYNINLKLNPLGNISGNSDFVYSNKLVDTRIQIDMPLSFSANQLVFADTINFSIANATNFDPIGPSTIYLIAKNGFPFDLDMMLFLIDKNNAITDTLLVPGLISSASVGTNAIVTNPITTKISIPIDAARKSRLLTTERIGIRAKFNSPNYPQLTQLYSNYRLDIKLIGDGTYYIR